MTRNGYPLLKEDIFFAKIQNDSGLQVKIRNTTTEKDYKPTPDTVALLDLCTGTHTVDEIIHMLSEQHDESVEKVAEDVSKILTVLQKKDIITVESSPLERSTPPAKEVKVRYPIEFAQIEITNRCNLHCLHCANDSGDPSPDELTTEDVLSAIDKLSSLGVYVITLTGGEPLLHPDLFEIVEHARKAPMTVGIFTNGTLITEEHVKRFKKLGVKQFAVSIDSMNEHTHDRFRGRKGALRKTLNGINLLKEAGFSVRVSLSLVQLNKNEIVDTLKRFKEHNFTDYQYAVVNFSGRGVDGVAISPEEYYHILVEQLIYKREFLNEIPKLPLKPERGCDIAQNVIYIKADGTILPCHGCIEDMGVGNIRDVDLEKFWDTNETLEMLRNTRAENDNPCTDCKYLAFCTGCIANAFILERKFRCYDPYACARLRAYDKVFEFTK